MIKKIAIFLLACFLTFVSVPTFAEVQPWLPQDSTSAKTVGLFHAPSAWTQFVQVIQWPENMNEPGVVYRPILNESCEGFTGACSESKILALTNPSVSVVSFMPICKSDEASFCIEGLNFKSKSATVWSQMAGKEIGIPFASIASRSLDLPEGGRTSVWVTPDGKKTVSFVSRADWSLRKGKMEPLRFEANLYATEILPGSKKMGLADGVVWSEQTRHGQWVNASLDDEYQIKVRVPSNYSRFISSRMESASFTASTGPSGYVAISLTGSPVDVPYVRQEFDEAWWKTNWPAPALPLSGVRIESGFSEIPDGRFWNELVRASGDKSSGYQRLWSFSILSQIWNLATNSYDRVGSEFDNCLTRENPIVGLVSTNAMHVSPLPPLLKEGFFEYRVSGMHFSSDGSLTSGNVEYLLNAEITKCLYKYPEVPVSARVNIISSGGDESITTVVTNRVENNIGIVAHNVHFSSPKVSIQLLKPAVPEAPKPSASPSPSTVPVPKPTTKTRKIICVLKGKTKVVVGVAPKCPKGYSLKK